MNTFRFDSADEYSAILRGEKPLETSHEYGGKYCVLIDKYKHKLESKNEWVRDFKGERCVIIDGGDKPNYWEPFIGFCTDSPHIFVKDNSYTPNTNPNVRNGCYRPGDKSIAIIKKMKLAQNKNVDEYFHGDMHYGRHVKAKVLKRMCQKKGRTFDIGGTNYSRETNLARMSAAENVWCFAGKGDRTRRHWEALLVGANPISEGNVVESWPIYRTADFDIARKCFIDCTVPIHLRMVSLYALYAEPQLWTYQDVEKAEEKHGLS